jgi:hypothetical protein
MNATHRITIKAGILLCAGIYRIFPIPAVGTFYYFSPKSASMKKVTCLLWFVCLVFTATAQGVFSNQTNITLKKVIEDYRFSSKKEFSWNRELFAATDFEQARNKYTELYHQIHNTIIKLDGEKPVILNGVFEMPDKAKKQTTVYFNFLPATGSIQKLKVELLLQFHDGKWTISLQVYEPQEIDFHVTG